MGISGRRLVVMQIVNEAPDLAYRMDQFHARVKMARQIRTGTRLAFRSKTPRIALNYSPVTGFNCTLCVAQSRRCHCVGPAMRRKRARLPSASVSAKIFGKRLSSSRLGYLFEFAWAYRMPSTDIKMTRTPTHCQPVSTSPNSRNAKAILAGCPSSVLCRSGTTIFWPICCWAWRYLQLHLAHDRRAKPGYP